MILQFVDRRDELQVLNKLLAQKRADLVLLDVKCHKDCERRTNREDVSVRVCIKAKCEFFKPEGCYCQKYFEESRRRHKPTPFQFSKRLRPHKGSVGGWFYRDL